MVDNHNVVNALNVSRVKFPHKFIFKAFNNKFSPPFLFFARYVERSLECVDGQGYLLFHLQAAAGQAGLQPYTIHKY